MASDNAGSKKGHTRCIIAFGWSNVEIMRRQVSD
jgi:hypothetical protein